MYRTPLTIADDNPQVLVLTRPPNMVIPYFHFLRYILTGYSEINNHLYRFSHMQSYNYFHTILQYHLPEISSSWIHNCNFFLR